MKWVTRERPKTDRIACPWLIRRFIDLEAEIVYAPADEVLETARNLGARSFDAPGADFTHRNGACTFEVLIEAFGLGARPGLARLARIVHAADVAQDLHTDPLGPGLLAIGEGGLLAEGDDQRLLQRGSFVYDALYEWCLAMESSDGGGLRDNTSSTDPVGPSSGSRSASSRSDRGAFRSSTGWPPPRTGPR